MRGPPARTGWGREENLPAPTLCVDQMDFLLGNVDVGPLQDDLLGDSQRCHAVGDRVIGVGEVLVSSEEARIADLVFSVSLTESQVYGVLESVGAT